MNKIWSTLGSHASKYIIMPWNRYVSKFNPKKIRFSPSESPLCIEQIETEKLIFNNHMIDFVLGIKTFMISVFRYSCFFLIGKKFEVLLSLSCCGFHILFYACMHYLTLFLGESLYSKHLMLLSLSSSNFQNPFSFQLCTSD